MKSIQSMKWIAFLGLATFAVAAQDPITIRRELKVGSTETYKVENEVKQFIEIPSMGEQDMILTTVATIAVKTNKVDAEKGTADVETLTKIEKTSMDGSIASMMGGNADSKLPDPKAEKGTLDARNRLVIAKDPKAKPAGGAGGMMSMMGMGSVGAQALLSLIELPEKPIKIGDEMLAALPGAASLASAGMKDLKMKMTFVGEKEVEGQKLWVISYSGEFKLDIDPSKSPQPAGSQGNPMQGMKISGTGTISGEGLVDKATGKTVSNVMIVKNNLKVFLEQLGADMPVRGTVTSKLSLVK